MTPPLPGGNSFSGRSRSLKGQPGPEYVFRRVHVSVHLAPAREAAELCLRDTVPGRDVPALRASLRSMTGVDLDNDPSSAFSLGVQHAEKHPHPVSRMDLFSPALAAAPFGSQIPSAAGRGLGRRVMFPVFSAS